MGGVSDEILLMELPCVVIGTYFIEGKAHSCRWKDHNLLVVYAAVILVFFLRYISLCRLAWSSTHCVVRLALNLWPSSCLTLPKAGVIGVRHQAWW